jgi:hypothetical protein
LPDKYSFTRTYHKQVGFTMIEDRHNDVLFMCRKSLTGNVESILDKKAYSDMKKQLEELEDLLIQTDEELQRSKAEFADLQLAKDSCGDNTNNVSPSAPSTNGVGSAGDRLHAENVIRRMQKKHNEELQTAKDEITRLQALLAASKLQSNDKVPLDNDDHPPAVLARGGGSGSEVTASLPTCASKNGVKSWAEVASSAKNITPRGHHGFVQPPAPHTSDRASVVSSSKNSTPSMSQYRGGVSAPARDNPRFVPPARAMASGPSRGGDIRPLARGQRQGGYNGVERGGSYGGPSAPGRGAPNMPGPGYFGRGDMQRPAAGGARYIPRQDQNGRGGWRDGGGRNEGGEHFGKIITYNSNSYRPFGYIKVDGIGSSRREDNVKFTATQDFIMNAGPRNIHMQRVAFKLIQKNDGKEYATEVRFA